MTRIEDLPDDPALLKQLIIDREQQLHAVVAQERDRHQSLLARIREEAADQIAKLKADHQAAIDEAVKAAVAAILRRYYGPRSEKFDPRQLLLFGDLMETAPIDEASVEDEAGEKLVTRRIKNRHKHGRQQLPEQLERIEIEHDLADDEKPCPCCGESRCRIGSEITEQLEYFPASFKVLRHIQHKYACKACDHDGHNPNIESASKPAQPIDKGLPGPSLLAYVITSKLGDHLPLYRLERIFERQQVHIARSTLCAWMRAAGQLVTPLLDLMTDRVKQSRVIHTDDTTVPVQSPGEKQCRKGRIWCYVGDEANPYIVYDYTPNRRRDGPAEWLSDFEGYLQADAYGGYDGIFSGGKVTEVACWAHARRKFYDAKDSDARRAAEMLAMIGELYAIERQAKDALAAERFALRQERSNPVLDRIKAWLDIEGEVVLPRSPMATAINYAKNQWAALTTYTTQGFLAIDNNVSERALKRVALGRKNWLFAGNDAAGVNHARLWTLIASAERHALDPQRYLTSILARFPSISPEDTEELAHFLPDVWKREDAAEPIAGDLDQPPA